MLPCQGCSTVRVDQEGQPVPRAAFRRDSRRGPHVSGNRRRIFKRIWRPPGRVCALHARADGPGLHSRPLPLARNGVRRGILSPLSESCAWALAPGFLHGAGNLDAAVAAFTSHGHAVDGAGDNYDSNDAVLHRSPESWLGCGSRFGIGVCVFTPGSKAKRHAYGR